MDELFYTDVEIRKDKDGFDVKYVYVPILDEWMTEDEFFFEKACYDPAIKDAQSYEKEHNSDDTYLEVKDYFEDNDTSAGDDEFYKGEDVPDYSTMTREDAIEEFNRTGINRTEYDLNDWAEINRRLGYDFFKPKK